MDPSSEYARYQLYDPGWRLVCHCGATNWKSARVEEGIGGRRFWSIDNTFIGFSVNYGCGDCRRIIDIIIENTADNAFPVIARSGDPVREE